MKKAVKKAVKKPVSKIDEFLEIMSELNPEALYPSDMKEAIVGYVERAGTSPQILLDREKCIKIIMKDGNMPYEDSIDYFEFNTIGSFMGEAGTPCFATFISKNDK